MIVLLICHRKIFHFFGLIIPILSSIENLEALLGCCFWVEVIYIVYLLSSKDMVTLLGSIEDKLLSLRV